MDDSNNDSIATNTNSEIAFVSCLALIALMIYWLGWRGAVACVLGGIVFSIGTVVNLIRAGWRPRGR